MEVEWETDASNVLVNPKLPIKKREHTIACLQKRGLTRHIWFASSGTTQKNHNQMHWVALSKEALLASAAAVNRHLEATANDHWLHALPDFHVAGIGMRARAYLSGSQLTEFCKPWDAHVFHQLLSDSQATLTALVPTQLYDLLAANLKAPKSLRAVIIGGGSTSPCLYRIAKRFNWPVLPSYGLTECSSQVATAPLSAASHAEYPSLKPLEHVELKTDDDHTLSIRSSALLTEKALVCSRAATFEDPKVDGWLETDDRAKLHDPVFELLGRRDESIKILGENVSMTRLNSIVESIFLELEEKGEGYLIASKDDRCGYRLVLFYANLSSASLEKLLEKYHRNVMPYESINQVQRVDLLPRNSLNKVMIGKLKALSSN